MKNVILEGPMGSHAYGLATPDSDIDLYGVWVAPVEQLVGLNPPTEKSLTVHRAVQGGDDYTYHEVGKFCRLAAGGNPTVLETLFSETVQPVHPAGAALKEIRAAFLSERIRTSFIGYAVGQAKRLEDRGDGSFGSNLRKHREKHARHCARLLQQGLYALQTGDLKVTVDNREELFAIGRMSDEDFIQYFERMKTTVDTVPSVLPREPNYEAINDTLLAIRRQFP